MTHQPGLFDEDPKGNSQLVDYGIQNEESDFRAHVGFACGICYVFETGVARTVVERGTYPKVPAWQPGYSFATAYGFLVPPDEVPRIKEVAIPGDIFHGYRPKKSDDTTKKGAAAVAVVKNLLFRGVFPLYPKCLTPRDIQDIAGTDIIVTLNTRIQIKCDWSAGPKEHGGSGNLFLQVAECNPGKKY